MYERSPLLSPFAQVRITQISGPLKHNSDDRPPNQSLRRGLKKLQHFDQIGALGTAALGERGARYSRGELVWRGRKNESREGTFCSGVVQQTACLSTGGRWWWWGDRSTVACCKARLSLLCVPSTPCVQRTRVMDVKRAPSPSPTEPLCAQRRQSKSLARAHSARHTVLQHVRPSASHQHLRFGIPVLCTSPHPPHPPR